MPRFIMLFLLLSHVTSLFSACREESLSGSPSSQTSQNALQAEKRASRKRKRSINRAPEHVGKEHRTDEITPPLKRCKNARQRDEYQNSPVLFSPTQRVATTTPIPSSMRAIVSPLLFSQHSARSSLDSPRSVIGQTQTQNSQRSFLAYDRLGVGVNDSPETIRVALGYEDTEIFSVCHNQEHAFQELRRVDHVRRRIGTQEERRRYDGLVAARSRRAKQRTLNKTLVDLCIEKLAEAGSVKRLTDIPRDVAFRLLKAGAVPQVVDLPQIFNFFQDAHDQSAYEHVLLIINELDEAKAQLEEYARGNDALEVAKRTYRLWFAPITQDSCIDIACVLAYYLFDQKPLADILKMWGQRGKIFATFVQNLDHEELCKHHYGYRRCFRHPTRLQNFTYQRYQDLCNYVDDVMEKTDLGGVTVGNALGVLLLILISNDIVAHKANSLLATISAFTVSDDADYCSLIRYLYQQGFKVNRRDSLGHLDSLIQSFLAGSMVFEVNDGDE